MKLRGQFCLSHFREVSLPEKETTRFFFFSKNDERLHGKSVFWLNGIYSTSLLTYNVFWYINTNMHPSKNWLGKILILCNVIWFSPLLLDRSLLIYEALENWKLPFITSTYSLSSARACFVPGACWDARHTKFASFQYPKKFTWSILNIL